MMRPAQRLHVVGVILRRREPFGSGEGCEHLARLGDVVESVLEAGLLHPSPSPGWRVRPSRCEGGGVVGHSGQAPLRHHDGWQFVSVVEDGNVVTLTTGVPGREPLAYRFAHADSLPGVMWIVGPDTGVDPAASGCQRVDRGRPRGRHRADRRRHRVGATRRARVLGRPWGAKGSGASRQGP